MTVFSGDKKAQVSAAIAAHGEWKQRILSAISKGSSDFEPSKVRDHTACKFGKWVSTINPSDKPKNFSKISDLHAKFHKEASRILKLAISGKKDEAKAAIAYGTEYATLTTSLVRELMAWKKSL